MGSVAYDNGNYRERHEQVTFLTNKEKMSPKRKTGVVVGVLLALLVLAVVAGVLIWVFLFKPKENKQAEGPTASQQRSATTLVYSGHMELSNLKYSQALPASSRRRWRTP
ncbi:hypothetical protein ANANG_G00000520 [Anguilla anguilla]|uniref:SEA domain-containing protein n=1 Tax=Anguilla anguilla TaxID=7936 RepID=A0A9D3SAE5_ANGAN|nr:hypothetical protein ANANG_G00000520 [Anguilla anguilla]